MTQKKFHQKTLKKTENVWKIFRKFLKKSKFWKSKFDYIKLIFFMGFFYWKGGVPKIPKPLSFDILEQELDMRSGLFHLRMPPLIKNRLLIRGGILIWGGILSRPRSQKIFACGGPKIVFLVFLKLKIFRLRRAKNHVLCVFRSKIFSPAAGTHQT